MADERVDSEIVSQFLLNTCRLRSRLTEHTVQAAVYCALMTRHVTDDDVEADSIPLITGSVDEFYIEPMLPFVGDIDLMGYCSNQVAIPRGHPPPTQLPAEFHNYVNVSEIVDSHFPGYVYLEARYLLTYCPEDQKYHYVDYDRGCYFSTTSDEQSTVRHGPAVLNDNSDDKSLLSVDGILLSLPGVAVTSR